MSSYRLAGRAQADLDEIWEFIAEHNLTAADRLIDRFTAEFTHLAADPGIGQPRADLREDLRFTPSGNYLIFYEATGGGIRIVRVLHGARDYGPQMFSP